MSLLEGLNPQQKEAASTIDGPLLILAGAGSGKTRTITYRMAHMVKELKIDAASILAITFTNKAAREMRQRVKVLLKRKAPPQISTFHAFGLMVLKEDIEKLGYEKNFDLYDRADQLSLIRAALKNYDDGKAFDKQDILSQIGGLKNRNMSADDFVRSNLFDSENANHIAVEYCFRFMNERMRFLNAIDFDDILALVCKLFKDFPDIALKYSNRFKYLMVDEYQDTNPLQFEMIKGLTSAHQNICVVGDDDQSIYGFRGADITNILSFEKLFLGTKVIKLEENYRSTKNILKLANEVIKLNKVRKEKTMWTSHEQGQLPYLWLTGDDAHEAQIVIDEIDKIREKGGELSEIAILYRSNTQAPALEDQLRMAQVPYKIIGGKKLYERKEIKDIIAYLSLIYNPRNDTALRRIVNVPTRGVGDKTLGFYIDLAKEKKTTLLNVMSNHSYENNHKAVIKFIELINQIRAEFKELGIAASIRKLVDLTGYMEHIDKFYDSVNQASVRKNSLEMLFQAAERFEANAASTDTIKDFIEKILLADSQDNKKDDVDGNEVTMMTLHSSKGLEFDYVFMVGCEEELLPHKKTIQNNESMDEERRLCYVGITRARKKLFLTSCKERTIYNKNTPRHVSRFLIELKEHYKKQDRTTFEHLTEEEAKEYKSQVFSNLLASLD